VGCTQIQEVPAPTFPSASNLVITLQGDTTSFALGSNVHQGYAYTVKFTGLQKGRVLAATVGDSLTYIKTDPPFVGVDSGTYTICYGNDCQTAGVQFKHN
jgi:hypothetical protein